ILDDLGGALRALVARLQIDEDAALVERRAEAGGADGRIDDVDIGVLLDDRGDRLLPFRDGGEGGVLRRLGDGEDEAGILDREESLRHDAEKIDRGAERQEGGEQRDLAPSQYRG